MEQTDDFLPPMIIDKINGKWLVNFKPFPEMNQLEKDFLMEFISNAKSEGYGEEISE